jgi:glyoxylase-like metal-dependent hydrolase (beta-lactamase superfamily II)
MIWICSISNFIGGFSIIPTPGHTRGSVSMLYQKNGILYSGDLTITLFEETSPNDFTSELVLYTLLSRPSLMLDMQEASLYTLLSTLETLFRNIHRS